MHFLTLLNIIIGKHLMKSYKIVCVLFGTW